MQAGEIDERTRIILWKPWLSREMARKLPYDDCLCSHRPRRLGYRMLASSI